MCRLIINNKREFYFCLSENDDDELSLKNINILRKNFYFYRLFEYSLEISTYYNKKLKEF